MSKYWLFVYIFSICCRCVFAGGDIDLSPDIITGIKASLVIDAETRALMNAITNNNVNELAINKEFYTTHNSIFNHKINVQGITDQASSGRCWIFAALNIMRPAVIKEFNLKEFEFSSTYLHFWDKLEKSNMFLEAMIETANRDINDREIQVLVDSPVPDGGWWNYIVALITKYGAMPVNFMPETKNSSNTKMMNTQLEKMMRCNAVEIRKLVNEGKDISVIRKTKLDMLKQVYRMLILHLGVPPEEFTWRYEDKDGTIFEKTYTPLSFYQDAVELNLSNYVSIFHYPVHTYNKKYRINYCRNMTGMPDMDFLNLDIERLKEFTLKSLLNNEAVWFSADVGKDNDNKHGILARGIYDYESLYGVSAKLTKADRLLYRASTPNHAMTFVGVDTLNDRPVKWRVENSWGADRGNKGYWTMYDNWFEEYLYSVIINKLHLSDDVLELLKMKPVILPAWDPMWAAFW